MGKTLIAIPCYNCEVQIPRVLNKIYTSLKDKVDLVLIIENQSNRDNTLKAAVACAQKLDNDFFKIGRAHV